MGHMANGARLSRRDFLKHSLCWLPFVQSLRIAPHALPASTRSVTLSHREYLRAMRAYIADQELGEFIAEFQTLLWETARNCVLEDGQWIIPSYNYANYFFARDSFWVLAALRSQSLSAMAVNKFRAVQANALDGHIATALDKHAAAPARKVTIQTSGAWDEESTMLYVLHNYLLKTLGGDVDQPSLAKAYGFIQTHIRNGRYVTTGEVRSRSASDAINQIGAFHYWADTYRPSGRPVAMPQVLAYNQGLLCVALRCLEVMEINVSPQARQLAESHYASIVNPKDGVSLPQREGASVMDVSALVGEALSLYLFDTPLLSDQRVLATLNRLARVSYRDGTFLGFKVISDFTGAYRPANEFTYGVFNTPGNYQNGGSWLLYDALALYCGIRHRVPNATAMFTQRLMAEVRNEWASHEFISTHPSSLGANDKFRDGYGWNAFVLRLLPQTVRVFNRSFH